MSNLCSEKTNGFARHALALMQDDKFSMERDALCVLIVFVYGPSNCTLAASRSVVHA